MVLQALLHLASSAMVQIAPQPSMQLMSYIILAVIMPNLFSNLQKILSSIENVKIIPILTLLVISGIQRVLSLTILLLHLFLLYFNQMAPKLSLLSLKLSSSLKSLLPILLWMILGIFLLLFHLLTTSIKIKIKIKILHYDVFQALSGLDSLKAYGPDGVPPVVLKNCASELAHCLVKLFRLCLSTSTYLSCWMFAHIQPIPKKGDHSNSSNYRPITLICYLFKTFESVLNKKIMRHLLAHNLLSDCQHGFRKGRSTGDLIAFVTES